MLVWMASSVVSLLYYGKTDGMNLVWHGHAGSERAEEAYVKLVMLKEGVRDATAWEWRKKCSVQ